MKNWRRVMLTAAALALMSSVQSVSGQATPQSMNSARNSAKSDVHANKHEAEPHDPFEEVPERRSLSAHRAAKQQEGASQIVKACAAVVDELKASRVLIEALETESAELKTRLETEKRTTAILTELNETRKSESEAMRAAMTAKNETITAKDQVIASQDKLIAALKNKKPSPLRRIGDILIGAAVFAILK